MDKIDNFDAGVAYLGATGQGGLHAGRSRWVHPFATCHGAGIAAAGGIGQSVAPVRRQRGVCRSAADSDGSAQRQTGHRGRIRKADHPHPAPTCRRRCALFTRTPPRSGRAGAQRTCRYRPRQRQARAWAASSGRRRRRASRGGGAGGTGGAVLIRLAEPGW